MDNKNYKIVKLKGGLGNQLFQYSLAIYLKRQLKQNVKLDLSWFKTQSKRKFLLNDYLNIEFETLKENNNNFLNKILAYRSEKIITNFLKNKKINYINQFDGYWQDIFFADYLNLTNFKKSFLKNTFSHSDYYVLHYRSGDFKVSKAHNILNIDYYKKAIQYFTNKKTYLLTTDISDFDKNFLIENKIEFLNLDEKEAFVAILYAKGGIASNSTFSWWPIYLSQNKNWVFPFNWLKKKNIFNANLHIPGTIIL